MATMRPSFCSRSINTLLDLRNNLKPDLIQAALDILKRANKIEFYGQGTSGFVAADASPDALADALVAAYERRVELRASTAGWFAEHAVELSMRSSLERVVQRYRAA